MSIKMKIKVTKEILRKSMWCGTDAGPKDISHNCAVALAVRDIFPYATIGKYGMFIGSSAGHDVDLPKEAKDFITQFDILKNRPYKRLELPELEFEIEIPDKVLSKIGNGNIEEIKTIIQNSEILELV